MLHLSIGEFVENTFREKCRRKGVTMTEIATMLIEGWTFEEAKGEGEGEGKDPETRRCQKCGRAIPHENETIPFCSHECAGLDKVPLKDGMLVVVKTGQVARVNITPGRGFCRECGRRFNGYAIVGGRGKFCTSCVVLQDFDYGPFLIPPASSDLTALLEYVKRGGVLPDDAEASV